jgi:hypothetical protein
MRRCRQQTSGDDVDARTMHRTQNYNAVEAEETSHTTKRTMTMRSLLLGVRLIWSAVVSIGCRCDATCNIYREWRGLSTSMWLSSTNGGWWLITCNIYNKLVNRVMSNIYAYATPWNEWVNVWACNYYVAWSIAWPEDGASMQLGLPVVAWVPGVEEGRVVIGLQPIPLEAVPPVLLAHHRGWLREAAPDSRHAPEGRAARDNESLEHRCRHHAPTDVV